jgi:hypothetical protein
MTRQLRFSFLFLGTLAFIAAGQNRRGEPPDSLRHPDIKLPSGKSQSDEIVRADHKRNIEDSAKLAVLSEELRDELAASESFVVSVKTIRKVEEIEKLAKNIRGRLKRN